jgi:iron(III) transport system permease protein
VRAGELLLGDLRIPSSGGDREARVYLRPEDVLARPIADGDPHVFDASIEKIEFLGSYCHVHVAAPAVQPNKLTVYLSLNYLSEASLAVGSPLKLRCCPSASRSSNGRRPARSRGGAGAPGGALERPHRHAGPGRLVALLLVAFLALPLLAILQQALQDPRGRVRLAGQLHRLRAHAVAAGKPVEQPVGVGAGHVIAVPLAFGFAYALTRSCMPLKPLFRGITLIPLLAPSLLSAISLIYWFGNQGVLPRTGCRALGIAEIYGAPGIVIGECFAVFPHALMILVTALSLADARLYEAADAMGTSAARKFFTITLPGAKYGLISAALVTFTLVITDFGIPKVIGGNFNVLATDVFKLVIGQQDFAKGAVVAILLLAPAVLTFAVDHYVSRARPRCSPRAPCRIAQASARLRRRDDGLLLRHRLPDAGDAGHGGLRLLRQLLALQPGAQPAPLHDGAGRRRSRHRLHQQPEDGGRHRGVRHGAGVLRRLPAGKDAGRQQATSAAAGWLRSSSARWRCCRWRCPGLVLGLGYIFFFNAPGNPLGGLYHTLTLLTLCTIVHFYTTGHLTAVTALKSLDGEFEAVSASLKVPFFKTFWRVTVPICLPALVDIARYFFVNAMTTISAVVFLYSPETKVASIAILNLDEAGEMGAAAAMAVMIAAASAVATLLFMALAWWVQRRTQAWRTLSR